MVKSRGCNNLFQSQGNCCLSNLSFTEDIDLQLTTDIFIVLDPSASFDLTREYTTNEINKWYNQFRINNPDHVGNVYFYKGAKSDIVGTIQYNNPIHPLIGTKTDLYLVENISLPLVTNLVFDNYSTNLGYSANEGWLSYPGVIRNLSSEFVDLGYSSPDDVLFIYIGDESSFRGAYYHGCREIVTNGLTENCNTTGALNNIQIEALSDPVYNTGYVEHYNEFTNTYYNQFKFFKGIVYGITVDEDPINAGSIGLPIFHSHIYQAIEPSTVSEEDFIESSYALTPAGDPTGFSLDFIKTTNYLADAGYAGLKNYGWSELHDVGYGDISESFTAEIFKLNVEKVLATPSKLKLTATLSNGNEIESQTFNVGSDRTKVSSKDNNPGYLSSKILPGTGMAITNNNDNSLTISSTVAAGTDLGAYIFIPEVGTDAVQNWDNFVAKYAEAKAFASTIGGFYRDTRGTILLPSGDYDASIAQLTLDTEYLDIIGIGTPIFTATRSTSTVGVLHIAVANVSLISLNSYITYATPFIYFDQGCSNLIFKNLTLFSNSEYSIKGDNNTCQDALFENIYFYDRINGAKGYGIKALNFSGDSRITNCRADAKLSTKNLFNVVTFTGTTIVKDCEGIIDTYTLDSSATIINLKSLSVNNGQLFGTIMNSEIDNLGDVTTSTRLYNVITDAIYGAAVPKFATNTVVNKSTTPALYIHNTTS